MPKLKCDILSNFQTMCRKRKCLSNCFKRPPTTFTCCCPLICAFQDWLVSSCASWCRVPPHWVHTPQIATFQTCRQRSWKAQRWKPCCSNDKQTHFLHTSKICANWNRHLHSDPEYLKNGNRPPFYNLFSKPNCDQNCLNCPKFYFWTHQGMFQTSSWKKKFCQKLNILECFRFFRK